MEIDPNDLVVASQRAEVLGLRVMGWYHSHPHITVKHSLPPKKPRPSLTLSPRSTPATWT